MSLTPTPKLYTALLAFQRAAGPVRKNAVNPHLKSKYADLTSVLDTIEQPLWDNGLLIVQRFQYDRIGLNGSAGESTPILITELIHAASGERLESVVGIVCKDPTDPQKIGAAITYYRRYSLLALLGLSPEDDDGHMAAQPPTNHPANQSAPPRRTPPPPSELRPAAAPSAAAGTRTMTDDAFGRVVDTAWEMAEDNKPLIDIKNFLNLSRHEMTKGMREAVVMALAKIEAEHYAPASIAG